jgi:hypothetical protein
LIISNIYLIIINMPIRELFAPNPLNPVLEEDPTIFLAGPIQGAPNWQANATELIRHKARLCPNDTVVANPRRAIIDPKKFNYAEQVAWEKQNLKRAAEHGAIIFWFAAQDPQEPYEEGRPYGKTTFGEFNRVVGWMDYDPSINVVVGMDAQYDGLSRRYIIELVNEKSLTKHTALEEVAEAAVAKAVFLG